MSFAAIGQNLTLLGLSGRGLVGDASFAGFFCVHHAFHTAG